MTDAQCIEAIKANDQAVMRNVYERYRQECVHWLCGTYGLEIEEATEIYQETTLVFFENVFQGKLTDLTSSLKTYLFGIAKNIARKSNASLKKELYVEMVPEGNVNTDDASSEEAYNSIEECLSVLGEPYKTVLIDFYYFGHSMKQIADKCGFKDSDTAKAMKYRAVVLLRKVMGPRLIELLNDRTT